MIKSSILSVFIHKDLESISTNFGIPPLIITAWAVETKVRDGRITSLFFISTKERAKFNAAVPLLTAIQSFDFTYFFTSFSKYSTFPNPEPDVQ